MPLASLTAALLAAVTILPLGDSLTTGCQDVTQLDRASYRLILQDRLREAGTAYDFVGNRPNQCSAPSYDLDHAGHSGYTVELIVPVAEKLVAHFTPDIVLLLAGTNNHNDSPDHESFLRKYEQLLDTLGDRPVYTATIPRFGERHSPTPWPEGWLSHRNDSWIPTMNTAIRAAAATRRRVRVVDFYAAMEPARHLLADGVHLNAAGQEVLADLFWEAAFERDYDASGLLDAADIDQLTQAIHAGDPHPRYDVNRDGMLDTADRDTWLADVMGVAVGDADLDGRFDSSDLVVAWTHSRYEREESAGWREGDWNGDLRFDSDDLIAAWSQGGYEGDRPRHALSLVPEPTAGALAILAGLGVLLGRRRRG